MTTWYVAKTGDDYTGDGSSGNPYKTITKAVTVASTYDSISIGAGTYDESVSIGTKSGLSFTGAGNDDAGTIVTGLGGSGIFTGTTASDVTISNIQLSGTVRYGVYVTTGNDWIIQDLLIRSIGQANSGDNYCGVNFVGTSSNKSSGHIVRRCKIYDIFATGYNEGFGIKIDYASNITIESCDIFLCRKTGIRVIRSSNVDIGYNTLHSCWCGTEWNDAVSDTVLHHNHIWHCTYGTNPKHAIGTASSYLRFEYNTVEDCADACVYLGGSGTVGDYWSITYNLFRTAKNSFVFDESSDVGTHVIIDYNCYHKIGGNPDYYYRDQDPSPDLTYSTLAAAQAGDPYANYETHGKDYVAGDETTYGCGGLYHIGWDWSPHAATCYDESSGDASNLDNFEFNNPWEATTEVCYADFDLGASLTWTRLIYLPYGHHNNWNPTAVEVYKSDNGTTWTLAQSFSSINWGGTQVILKFTSRQTARYFRFKVTATYGHVDAKVSFVEVGILSISAFPPTNDDTVLGQLSFPAVTLNGQLNRIVSSNKPTWSDIDLPALTITGTLGRTAFTLPAAGAGTITTDTSEPQTRRARKGSGTYTPGRHREDRDMRTLGRRLSSSMRYADRVWSDLNHARVSSASITSAYVAAAVHVPAPPEGWGILCDGFLNVSWGTGAGLDAKVSLWAGNVAIATAYAYTAASAGAECIQLGALWNLRDDLNLSLTIQNSTGRSVVDVLNSGLVARYVRSHD